MRKNILKTFRISLLLILVVIATQISFARATVAKEQYAQRLEQWKKLSPEERKNILVNYKKYKKLPDSEKAIVKKNYQEWQALPEQGKEKMKRAVRNFKNLPPQQQEKIIKEKRQRRVSAETRENANHKIKDRAVLPKETREITKERVIKDKKDVYLANNRKELVKRKKGEIKRPPLTKKVFKDNKKKKNS